jgi:hypothetical protein
MTRRNKKFNKTLEFQFRYLLADFVKDILWFSSLEFVKDRITSSNKDDSLIFGYRFVHRLASYNSKKDTIGYEEKKKITGLASFLSSKDDVRSLFGHYLNKDDFSLTKYFSPITSDDFEFISNSYLELKLKRLNRKEICSEQHLLGSNLELETTYDNIQEIYKNNPNDSRLRIMQPREFYYKFFKRIASKRTGIPEEQICIRHQLELRVDEKKRKQMDKGGIFLKINMKQDKRIPEYIEVSLTPSSKNLKTKYFNKAQIKEMERRIIRKEFGKVEYFEGNHHHRDGDEPAISFSENFDQNIYIKHGMLHRVHNPAIKIEIQLSEWYICGIRQNPDENSPSYISPSITIYNIDGKRWRMNDLPSREMGNTKMWEIKDKLSRTNGPAIQSPDSLSYYYMDKKLCSKNPSSSISLSTTNFNHKPLERFFPVALSE